MIGTLEFESFPLADISGFKKKMLNWLRPFSIFCYLDNHQYQMVPHQTDCLVAVGAMAAVEGNDLRLVDGFLQQHKWVFGHLSYELKNVRPSVSSPKKDGIDFPPFYFFSPQIVLEIRQDTLTIHAEDPGKIFGAIQSSKEFK